MVRRNKPFEEIYDLFAIRIILDTEDKNDCYTTLGIVNQMYPPVADRFKDYISIPKTNNYQSIHTTIVGPDGKLVEVQIRTRSMHEIAERGFAAHWRYKESKTTSDKDLENWVNWVRDIFESATKDEEKKDLIENFKLNLYQDEIYVFTPKGDLNRLPLNSTPVDFAFEIHSKVGDRKSTRLNSSHGSISYAVFCLKTTQNSTSLSFGCPLRSSALHSTTSCHTL